MFRKCLLTFSLTLALALSMPSAQAFNEPDVRGLESTQPTDPKEMDNVMGYYEGTYASFDTPDCTAQAMVVAEGNRAYRVVLAAQPMEGKSAPVLHFELPAMLNGATLNVFGQAGDKDFQGTLTEGVLTVNKTSYGGQFVLKKVDRHSPTEGMAPPEGAIVLLAYGPGVTPNLDAWKNTTWEINEDGSMQKGAGANLTNQSFGDVKFHMEFRTPYEPGLRGQMRGNSGLFFCDTYEVQVLDSFGVIPGAGDCGSIYNTAAPKAIAAYPPLAWQTYDIEFLAPRLNSDSSVKEPGRITVLHNGVKIHDQQEITHSTVDATNPPVAKGPIQLQDHGNIVRYRNIWIKPLD